MTMIIDCHGHYTVLPKAHDEWRERRRPRSRPARPRRLIPRSATTRSARRSKNQLRLLKERGADMTIFSPRASAMAPHVGDQRGKPWARNATI
jgi:4-oxalmesaconate hydratase